jgi:UDP-N-acetylmuramoyl-L-alanyl-D-glutamate--2,6-diaminopimelate ligase
VIVERAVPQTKVPMCLVPDTRQALARLCQALAGHPSESLSCIGVTGTDGKTVTSRLIASILREGGGSVGILDDLCREGCSDTPVAGAARSAPEVAVALAEMAARHATHAVLEVPSRALSDHVLAGVHLDAACFTNLTRAHLELHNSVASYRHMKGRLLKHLRPQGICILNRDDPACAALASSAPGPVLTYGMAGGADVAAEVIERNPAEQSFLLSYRGSMAAVRTRLIGDHHVHNCLAAAALGLAARLDLATVARGIERLETLPGRLERVGCVDSPRVYLDISPTPTALAAALSAVRRFGRRVWCVLGAPAFGDDEAIFEYAAVLQRLADVTFVAPTAADDEVEVQWCRRLAVALGRGRRLIESQNRPSALESAVRSAGRDDSVLVVGNPNQLNRDRATAHHVLAFKTERTHLGACPHHG